jgi:L-amino acid N-acyltransferase YncA
MLRQVALTDSPAVAEIYNHYVLHSVVTFEEEPVSPPEMERRIIENTAMYPWFVYEEDGKVIGYSYASKWKVRPAYKHTVEVSVYLAPGCSGRGIGKALYSRLIDQLRQQKTHAVIGGVALPNDVSIRLHESLGFEKIGHFREVGWKFGKWVDVGYWELIL